MAVRSQSINVVSGASEIITLPKQFNNPMVYKNQSAALQQLFIIGGTVEEVGLSHNGESFTLIGIVNGAVILRPNDTISIAHSLGGAPTIKVHQL
jgi:hypothetical protein